jgi:RNA polymerase sigma-70 factor (ECF subfamily)
MRNSSAPIRLYGYMPVDAMPFPEAAESETQRIARGLRQKDAALIGEMVDRYQYRLVRYLYYLTGRGAPVEDLVQETWVRVLARAAQYEGRSRFETWLFSIARNLAIDGLRRRPMLSLDDPQPGVPDENASAAFPAPEHTSPFLAAARGEDAVRLAAALELLEPIYREVLLLRFQEDLSLREIAEVVGAPVPTVSSRIHRGLGLLRSHWEGGANAF